MILFCDVDPSGRILTVHQCSSALAAEGYPAQGRKVYVTSLPDARTDYVDAQDAVQPRPALAGFDKTAITADDTDAATLTGLPDPVTVHVDGVAHEITGGMLTITSPMPATYAVEIRDAFPYLPFTAEITAI